MIHMGDDFSRLESFDPPKKTVPENSTTSQDLPKKEAA